MNHTVPRFATRRAALSYLRKYYKEGHWQQFRYRAYDYWKGICQECKKPIRPGTGWQIHHGEGTYEYLWKEDEVIAQMLLLHTSCHTRLESQKTKQRKAVVKARKSTQKIHDQTKRSATRPTISSMKKLKRFVGVE